MHSRDLLELYWVCMLALSAHVRLLQHVSRSDSSSEFALSSCKRRCMFNLKVEMTAYTPENQYGASHCCTVPSSTIIRGQ